MGKDFTERSEVVCYWRWCYYKAFLTWERYPSRWPNFSFFICFSFRELIYSYKIESWDRRNDNLWLKLPLLCLCWWYNLFLKRYYFYKAYGWHFWFLFIIFRIKTKLTKIWNCRYWSPERGSSGSLWYALYRSE